MHVRGAGAAGDNGISGSRSATSIVADPTANLHVAHDFTGSGYGIVENIAFVGGESSGHMYSTPLLPYFARTVLRQI